MARPGKVIHVGLLTVDELAASHPVVRPPSLCSEYAELLAVCWLCMGEACLLVGSDVPVWSWMS